MVREIFGLFYFFLPEEALIMNPITKLDYPDPDVEREKKPEGNHAELRKGKRPEPGTADADRTGQPGYGVRQAVSF